MNEERAKIITEEVINHLAEMGLPVKNRADMEKYFKEHPNSLIQQALEEQREMMDIKRQAIADGTFMKAPNGKPTNLTERQWLQVRTRAFKKWFGDWINNPANASKVIDENGEPKVMLRTDDANKTVMGRGDGGAFFATDNLAVAGSYASDEADLYKGFVNLKNPYIVKGESHGFFFEYKGKETTVQEAQPSLIQEGYDGVYFERTWDVGDYADVEPEDDYWANNVAMFDPNQFKSATDNNGMFSTENDDIQMAIGGIPNIFDEKFAESADNVVSLHQANVFLNNLAQQIETGKSLDNTTKEIFNEIINKVQNGEIRFKGTDGQVLGQNRLTAILTTLSRFGRERYRTSGRSGQMEKTLNLVKGYLQETGEWQEQIEIVAEKRFGKPSPKSGIESQVYFIGDNAIKLQSLSTAKLDLTKAIERILMQNKFDSTCQTEIIGVGQTQHGEFRLLLKQPHIKEAIEANKSEIKRDMKEKGFEYVGVGDYGPIYKKSETGEVVEDVQPRNVLKTKDGVLHYIDVIPSKDKKSLSSTDSNIVQFYTTPEGEVYGFVDKEGNIYLDERVITPEHPIHEYTHLWDRHVAEKNPELWKRGKVLMRQTSLWNEVVDDVNYGRVWKALVDSGKMSHDKYENLIASEVHAKLTGKKGAEILENLAKEKGAKGIISKLKQWLLDFWKELKATFSNWSQEEIDKLTLDDFIHMTIRDFADGINFKNLQDINQQSFPNSETKINIYAGTNENADLSNFAIRPFRHSFYNGGYKDFQSVEQAFQYIKATRFADTRANDGIARKGKAIEVEILETTDGAKLRQLGKSIKELNVPAWDRASSSVMKELLKESFEQNPQALQRLLSTGNATLTHTQDKGKWGKEFPKLLMEVREELKKQNPTLQSVKTNLTDSKNGFSENTINQDNFRSTKEGQFISATIAPYFNTSYEDYVNMTPEKQKEMREAFAKAAHEVAKALGIPLDMKQASFNIGGYEFNNGTESIVEPSFTFRLDTTPKKANLFAALMGDLGYEQQETVISQYEVDSYDDGNCVRHSIVFSDADKILKELEAFGIKNFTYDKTNGVLSILSFDEKDVQKYIELRKKLNTEGYELKPEETPIQSDLLEPADREALYREWLTAPSEENKQGEQSPELLSFIQKALEKVRFYSGIPFSYKGLIEPEENTIFVFGSNPEGRHGALAAKTAGNIYINNIGSGLIETPPVTLFPTPKKAKKASKPKMFIGGSPSETRKKYWKVDPEMKYLTDSVARRYGINPNVLRSRMDNEGFTDARINEINDDYLNNTDYATYGRELFNSYAKPRVAANEFGLDDVATYIENGTVKPINEKWGSGEFINEHGRLTDIAIGDNYSDNIGLMAAALKAFRDTAKKDFPNASNADLDRYALAYYNRGMTGGKNWVKNGAKGYNVSKYDTGGLLTNKFETGGKITPITLTKGLGNGLYQTSSGSVYNTNNGWLYREKNSVQLPEVVITGTESEASKQRRGKYLTDKYSRCVSPKGAGNMSLTAANAAKAQDALFPGFSGLVPNVFRGIDDIQNGNYLGAGLEALKAFGAGQATRVAANPSLLAPGSAFWVHPMTKTVAAGTAGSTGMDLLTRTVTPHNSWREGMDNLVQQTTGYDLDTWTPFGLPVGSFLLDSSNPGWYWSPSKALTVASKMGTPVNNIVENEGLAVFNPKGTRGYWVGRGLGSNISLEDAGNGLSRIAYIESKRPGTGRKLVDAAINVNKKQGGEGILSGEELLSAPKTYSTWSHYPNKQLVGNYGTHSNSNMVEASYEGPDVTTAEGLIDATRRNVGAMRRNGEVYKLTSPSENVLTYKLPDLATAYRTATSWRPWVPKDVNRYYRIVGRPNKQESADGIIDPIWDAERSGVIRGAGKIPEYNDPEYLASMGPTAYNLKPHDYPMFSKGKPWQGGNANLTSGKPTIIRSKSDTGPIVWEQSNVDFRHKGHEGIFRPSWFGDVNASPSSYFEYWRPRRFGYTRHDFPESNNPYTKILGTGYEVDRGNWMESSLGVSGSRFGDYIGSGGEQTVFQDTKNPGSVLKVYNDTNTKDMQGLREIVSSLENRNKVPLQEPITFEGFITDNGLLYPVHSQRKLRKLGFSPEEFTNDYFPQLEASLKSYGYKPVGNSEFSNGTTRITDVKADNTGITPDGQLRFFDVDSYPEKITVDNAAMISKEPQSVGEVISKIRRDATIGKYANNQKNPVEQMRERMSDTEYATKIRSHADPTYTSFEEPVYLEGYSPKDPNSYEGILKTAEEWWIKNHPEMDTQNIVDGVYKRGIRFGGPFHVGMSPHALIPNEETVFNWPLFKGATRDGAAKQLQYNIIKSHEGAHAYITPKEESPLSPFLDTSTSVGKYFYRKKNAELPPRGSQIKSYYGKNSINEEELRYAANHYVDDTGIDNNMTDMFNIIKEAEKKDPDIWRKMAEYFTETSAAIAAGVYLNK